MTLTNLVFRLLLEKKNYNLKRVVDICVYGESRQQVNVPRTAPHNNNNAIARSSVEVNEHHGAKRKRHHVGMLEPSL